MICTSNSRLRQFLIFNYRKDVVNSTQDETERRTNKRRNMMEIVEKKIIEASNSQVQVRETITTDQSTFLS